jgi:hypothetical protein
MAATCACASRRISSLSIHIWLPRACPILERAGLLQNRLVQEAKK